ncbi:MAG TPA: HdeD family acid-resistance protein [Solirubrobacteraceae bacterium]|nr:HdeD family acid-resistance protein [Solirubrobacteraceae bacterium]
MSTGTGRPIELRREDPADAASGWWLFVMIGIASLVAGVIVVLQPSHSLATLAVVAGIFLLLDGIVEMVESLGHSAEKRGLSAIIGILGIVVGILLIRHPTHAATAVGLLIGIWLIAVGVVRLLRALVIGAGLLWRIGVSLLEIAVGIAIVSNPHIGYGTLAVLLGIWLIVNGVGMTALGVAIHRIPPGVAAGSESASPAR